MPIYKGDRDNPTAIYFGDSSLEKVYLGMDLVWQKYALLFSFKTYCGTQEYAQLIAEGEGGITPWKWDLGDGTIVKAFSVTHNYDDDTEKTVNVYGIRSEDISIESIIISCYYFTNIDFSKIESFNKLNLYIYDINYSGGYDTELIFPDIINGSIGFVQLVEFSSQVIDFSSITQMEQTTAYYWGITEINNICGYLFTFCPVIEEIILPETVNGDINYFVSDDASSLTSLDLSCFEFADESVICIVNAPNLTSLVMPTLSSSGAVGYFGLNYLSSLTGDLDLSWITRGTATTLPFVFGDYTLGFSSYIEHIENVTSISFPSSFSGELSYLCINYTGVEELDLSMFLEYLDGFTIGISNNTSLTNIIFPDKGDVIVSGEIFEISIMYNESLATLDMSWIPGGSNIFLPSYGRIYIVNNSNLASITFPDSVIGGEIYGGIYLSHNNLSSIDLTYIPSYAIDVHNNNNLTSLIIPVSNCKGIAAYSCSLSTIDFTNFVININRSFLDIRDNALTASEVNKMLYDLDSLAASGYSERWLDFRGTNSAPDSSSGGYNGIAAKSSLQGKGFSVYTN